MTTAGGASPSNHKGELRVVGTSVTREVELLLERVGKSLGKRPPRMSSALLIPKQPPDPTPRCPTIAQDVRYYPSAAAGRRGWRNLIGWLKPLRIGDLGKEQPTRSTLGIPFAIAE